MRDSVGAALRGRPGWGKFPTRPAPTQGGHIGPPLRRTRYHPETLERSGDMARVNRNLGMLLLSIFLILFGLGLVIDLSFAYMRPIEGRLALAAGVRILIGR